MLKWRSIAIALSTARQHSSGLYQVVLARWPFQVVRWPAAVGPQPPEPVGQPANQPARRSACQPFQAASSGGGCVCSKPWLETSRRVARAVSGEAEQTGSRPFIDTSDHFKLKSVYLLIPRTNFKLKMACRGPGSKARARPGQVPNTDLPGKTQAAALPLGKRSQPDKHSVRHSVRHLTRQVDTQVARQGSQARQPGKAARQGCQLSCQAKTGREEFWEAQRAWPQTGTPWAASWGLRTQVASQPARRREAERAAGKRRSQVPPPALP